jgi:transposase
VPGQGQLTLGCDPERTEESARERAWLAHTNTPRGHVRRLILRSAQRVSRKGISITLKNMNSTDTNRKPYTSDLSDAEWAIIEPLLPPLKSTGRPIKYPRREILNGILYVLRNGSSWRNVPHDLPPWRSVYWYFMIWRNSELFRHINDTLRVQVRLQDGRVSEPSAAVIDSQAVKTTEKGGHPATVDLTWARK